VGVGLLLSFLDDSGTEGEVSIEVKFIGLGRVEAGPIYRGEGDGAGWVDRKVRGRGDLDPVAPGN